MKKLNKLFASVVLTLLLSASTFAGDGVIWPMRTDPTPPPPSSSVATNDESATEGTTETGETATDPATLIALNLLNTLLTLF
jgi:hypothetical protein